VKQSYFLFLFDSVNVITIFGKSFREKFYLVTSQPFKVLNNMKPSVIQYHHRQRFMFQKKKDLHFSNLLVELEKVPEKRNQVRAMGSIAKINTSQRGCKC
jgi:hypothetical protein